METWWSWQTMELFYGIQHLACFPHTYCSVVIFPFFENLPFFKLIEPERRMEPVNLAQKRSSNIMDQKGSGNTSTTSTHPSPDLVECHYVASTIPWYELCSLTSICPLNLTTGFSFVSNMVAKYYLYDNYFDLPGALLCGRVVDMLHKVIFDS